MANEIAKFEESLPTYQETFQEIGRQIKSRKKMFLIRTLLIIWPVILLFILKEIFINENTLMEMPLSNIITATLSIILTLFYYAVLSSIFNIEKRIWVDSFFDKEILTSAQSWRIAIRLFFPNLKLSLMILLRYILTAIILCVLFIVIINFIILNRIPNIWIFWTNIFLVTSLFLYFYYLKVRLRYIYFIFLDSYNTENFSYTGVFKEMNKFNQKYKEVTTARTLLFILGSQLINSISSQVLSGLQAGLGNFRIGGKILGSSMRIFGEELSKQLTSFSRMIAVYLLYKFIRSEIYGETQYTNRSVYDLK
jgi:hypothetical protein